MPRPPGRPRKMTDEEIASAQVMRLAKYPLKVICERFGISRTKLWEALGGKNVQKLIGDGQATISEHKKDSQTDESDPQIEQTR